MTNLERLQLFQRIFPTFEKSNALIKLRHQVWLHSLLKKMEWCLNARLCYLCRISHNIHMNKGLTPNLCICAADLHSCNQTKFSEALFWHFKHLQHKPRFDRNIKFHSGTRNTLNFQSSCTLHHIWWWWWCTLLMKVPRKELFFFNLINFVSWFFIFGNHVRPVLLPCFVQFAEKWI